MHALTCPPSLLLCKIHGSWMQPNLPKQGCARPIVCIIKKRHLNLGPFSNAKQNGPNAFPSHQFRNNMFHSEIGTRNKRVLNGQFGNNVFHSEIGTWTKTVGMLADKNLEQSSPNLTIWEHCVPLTDRNSEQNSPNLLIWEECVPLTDRNSEQNGPKLPIWEQCVPLTDRNSEQNGPKLPI